MYRTQYLIFKYDLKDGVITITDFKLSNVWQIINYNGKYPISLQSKKSMWYNIRPCCFNDMNAADKTPTMFIKAITEAVDKTPNKMVNKTRTINSIYNQFYKLQFGKIIQAFK